MSYFLLYMIFVYNKTCAKVFCGWLMFGFSLQKRENKDSCEQAEAFPPAGSVQSRKARSLTDLRNR